MMMSSASGVWSKRPVLLCLCLVGLMLAVLSWNRPDVSMEPHAGSFAAAQQASVDQRTSRRFPQPADLHPL
jgi:hypothetical protein